MRFYGHVGSSAIHLQKHNIMSILTEYLYGEKDYKAGQVLKMAPGYHTKKPYYVVVRYFWPGQVKSGELKMITSIPNLHECRMTKGSNWEYHKKRMSIVGTVETHGHLLQNQIIE